ncbi:hypothetical protein DFH06DRAFT_1471458 [Mycena polygramma]|nr:hypothetical protein DFH06DRAFT_1471458 [Mycena polygramma]
MFRATDSPDTSRRNSLAMSTFSATPSTRHILAPASPMSATFPPTPSSRGNLLAPPSPFGNSSGGRPSSPTNSLAANYLPTKFSNAVVSRRRNLYSSSPWDVGGKTMPRGGGTAAFRAGAARMPGAGDEDYDGVDPRGLSKLPGGGKGGKTPRWTRFKYLLVLANTLLTLYSLAALLFTLSVYLHLLPSFPILLVAHRTELALSTLAAGAGLATALLGWPGILLNNRAFLAVWTLLLWVCFGLLVVPGYITYKRGTLNLEGKVNQQWSQSLGGAGRLAIQSALGCCGYFSPFVEATVSAGCYARSVLPGCKADFLAFEKKVLQRWFTVVFGIVPVHVAIIATALLCANHVTYRFGKGMMPPAYRLSAEAARAILEGYEKQLAEEYGPDAAAQMIASSGGGAGGGGGGNGVYRRTPFEHHSSPGASPAASASDLNHPSGNDSTAHLVRAQEQQQYQQEHQRQQAQQREREVAREEREAQRREEYARLEREQDQHGYQDMQRQHGGGQHDEGESEGGYGGDGGEGGYGDGEGYDLSAYGRESAYGGGGGAYGGTGEHAQHDKYNF